MVRALWLAALFVGLFAGLAEATAVKKLDDESLVEAAKVIAHVEVVSTSTEWGPEQKRIFTRVRLHVRGTIKGEEREDLEVLLPGGARDGFSYVIHGMPQFRAGEEAVVFLTAEHPKSKICLPVGLGQGLYRVRREAGKPPQAVRDTRSLLLVEQGRSPRKGRLERLALDELLDSARGEVKKQREARRKREQEAREKREKEAREKREKESKREKREKESEREKREKESDPREGKRDAGQRNEGRGGGK